MTQQEAFSLKNTILDDILDVKNYAPDMDAISIKTSMYEIYIEKDAVGIVYVTVRDPDEAVEMRMVLGQEGWTQADI